ncbi:MAG: hypothetical protein IJZ88_03085 [Clostridia bacterium]|nr:hypothetical protein [Clostridia bacterium]
MIDLHSHILPEIDDGAQSLNEAVRLCALGRINHIKKIVATPHFNAIGDIDNFLKQRDDRLSVLRRETEKNNINTKLYAGAEVFVDDDIFYSNNLKRLTINNSKYLLVEFSFYGLKIKHVSDYLNEIFSMGVVPIVAHPERYEFFQNDYDAVNEFASRGVLFQLNAGSLASRDGREEFELAYEMAYKGIASFIATDAHSLAHRPNDIAEMLRQFPQDINPELMNKMLVINPQIVLSDDDMPRIRYRRIEKRRFY